MRQAIEPKDILVPQRRKLFARSSAIIGGILLGIGVGPFAPSFAQTQAKPSRKFTTSHLSPDIARHQLANSPTFQEASQHLGTPNWEQIFAYRNLDGSSKGLVIFYPSLTPGEHTSTFLAIDDPSTGTASVALIGQLTHKGSNHAELAWKTHKGVLLATQVFQDGKVTVIPVPQSLQSGLQVRPNFNVNCFIACLGANVSADCALSCLGCAIFGPIADAADCLVCALCAGPTGVQCAQDCNF